MTTDEQDREAFIAWASDKAYLVGLRGREGVLRDMDHHALFCGAAWLAWQAAKRHGRTHEWAGVEKLAQQRNEALAEVDRLLASQCPSQPKTSLE